MNGRILLVDDNPTNLKLAADVLEGAGHIVQRAIDAEEAQALVASVPFDLILMDIALPGMDGLTLTRKLKADPRFRSIPVVALTASAMKGDEAKARDAGCVGYITKPIDTRKFPAQIAQFMPERTSTAQTSKPTILIADDHISNRNLLRAGLEAEGFRVIDAINGAEALKLLERQPVDAVISDILMPVMDGFRLCHEIRKSTRPYAGLPFILYTATYDSPSDRELAATVGADAYLLKPSPMPLILAELRKAGQRAVTDQRPMPLGDGESYVLEQYNAALVRKLEQRNGELQQTLSELLKAHQDIVELNQTLEIRVEQRTAALDDANQQLESFSYSVAHDLRGPLRHISGFADILRETASERLDSEGREHISRILAAAKRMDDLIMDLLDFSRAAREQLRSADIELDVILDESLAALRTDIEGKSIELRRSALPRAQGDPALLRQVMINLLSNAIKYSGMREPAIVEIGSRPGRADEVVIFVRDNGVGFDMQYGSKLFGVFQRLHAAREFEGTGIGLASAKRIVSRHGGRIWAEAVVDQGATFYFSLPRARSCSTGEA